MTISFKPLFVSITICFVAVVWYTTIPNAIAINEGMWWPIPGDYNTNMMIESWSITTWDSLSWSNFTWWNMTWSLLSWSSMTGINQILSTWLLDPLLSIPIQFSFGSPLSFILILEDYLDTNWYPSTSDENNFLDPSEWLMYPHGLPKTWASID